MALSLEGHTARAFDGDLSSLHVQAVAMGALVIDQVQLAVNAYSGWDRSMATLVLERERKINPYDAEIEEAALQVIARRQPVAQDLRAVFAIDKVVTELERAADEAKKLALAVLADSESNGFRPGAATAREARQLGRLAVLMIRAALEAFDRLDPAAAAAVIHQDQEMDSEYAAALRRILTRAMEDARQSRRRSKRRSSCVRWSVSAITRAISRGTWVSSAGSSTRNATGVLPASFSVKN